MAETRTYQGHTYSRNGPGEPWVLSGPAASRSGVVIPDPYKARDEERKDQAQDFDARRIDLSAANNAREANNSRVDNPRKLRDDFGRLPEVQKYKIALAQAERAMGTAANPQGDLALTYAVAQAMDPMGSVREGDQAAIAGTQPALAGLVERIKKQFGMDGAGAYTPEARKQLRREVFSIIAAYKPLYDARRADASDYAKAVGVDPQEVIGRDDTAIYAPGFRKYGEMNGDDGTISRIIGGDPIKGAIEAPKEQFRAAGSGATETSVKIPAEMQAEQATYLNQNWGKLDPNSYTAFRMNLDRKYGLTPDPEAYRAEAPKMNEFARKGGTPDQMGAIPAPERAMSPIEQVWNDAVSSPLGTGVATAANGVGFGFPSRFAGDEFNALRTLNPKAALTGDIAGGIAGSLSGGAALKATAAGLGGASSVARVLANPLTADIGYGGIYGANDAAGRGESQFTGALTGGVGGLVGNKLGGAIGKAFPGGVKPLAVRRLDATVPTSDDLQTVASGLYANMEANGLTATGADTFALADSIKDTLAKAGRITPKDNLANTESPVNTAYKLVSDYAGEPMTPAQYQTVRSVIADGLESKTKADRKIAKSLLKTFDDWTDATNPAMKETWDDARAVSSRYLQGDALKEASDLAGVRAGQFSQAGMENALRVDFRALARDAIKKKGGKFTPEVNDAIGTVVDGTRTNNVLRALGALAPVSPSGVKSMILTMGGGGLLGGAPGFFGTSGLAVGSTVARALSGSLTKRAAQVAENTAYGGPEYARALNAITGLAGERGGDIATGITIGGVPYENDIVARLLAANGGAY